MFQRANKNNGFSLIEVIIVSAIALLFFGAIFSSFQYTLGVVALSRATTSAISLANDRMEYFRSLSYDNVGTISGIPPGTIPQNSTITLNNIVFQERVLVEYVDDPGDGQDTATTSDGNGIPADYKRVKAEYTWTLNGNTNSISLISNIVPRSVETTAGGGTVRINVIDDQSLPLPGASVRLINNTTTSTIDVTKFSDASGAALFSGAPAASGYEVIVTANIGGNQYSTVSTHQATTSLPNPSVAPFAVLESDVSTLTFQIGELSDLDILTLSDFTEGVFSEDFATSTTLASSTDVAVVGGELVLTDTAGVYEVLGTAFLGPIQPATLKEWRAARVAVDLPLNTLHVVRFYTAGTSTGPYTLIDDADLPDNGAGFIDTLIDLSALDPATYPSIYVGITIETTNTAETPKIEEFSVYYRETETVRPNVNFTLTGTKVIGTDSGLSPIYKYEQALTTDASGELSISDLEFDTYTINTGGAYSIASACPNYPFVQRAGVDELLEMKLVAASALSLRVVVKNGFNQPIPGASVNLSRSGYNVTKTTDSCGQVYFAGGGLVNAADYVIDVSTVGYTDSQINPFEVSGEKVTTVTLSES